MAEKIKYINLWCRIVDLNQGAKEITDGAAGDPALDNDLVGDNIGTIAVKNGLLTQLIKNSDPPKELAALHKLRYEAGQGLFYYVKGACYLPDALAKPSAEKIKAVLDKYTLSIFQTDYNATSSYVNALISDCEDAALAADFVNLPQAATLLTNLKTAQANFEARYLAYDNEEIANANSMSASELKMEIGNLINKNLIPVLRSGLRTNPAKYGHLANLVKTVSDHINYLVELHSQSEEEPIDPEQPTDVVEPTGQNDNGGQTEPTEENTNVE